MKPKNGTLKVIDVIKAKVASVLDLVTASLAGKHKAEAGMLQAREKGEAVSAKLIPVWDECKKLEPKLEFLPFTRLFYADIPEKLRVKDDTDKTLSAIYNEKYQWLRYLVYTVPRNVKRRNEAATNPSTDTFKLRAALVGLASWALAHLGHSGDENAILTVLKSPVGIHGVRFSAMSVGASKKFAKDCGKQVAIIRANEDKASSTKVEKQVDATLSAKRVAETEASITEQNDRTIATLQAQLDAIKTAQKASTVNTPTAQTGTAPSGRRSRKPNSHAQA